MSYIIEFKDMLTDLGEFLATDGDGFKFVLVPEHADTFRTKKEAKDFLANNIAWDVPLEIVKLKDASEAWRMQLDDGIIIRTIPCKSPLSRKYSGEGRDEVLKWRIEQRKALEASIDYEDYKTWPDLYEVFDHLWSVQMFRSADYNDAHMSFQVRVARDSKYSNFKRELMKVLKHITYKDADGNLVLHVFDHFLSEGGNSVNLVITGKDTAKVVDRWDDAHVEGSLRECFYYMCRERYYE